MFDFAERREVCIQGMKDAYRIGLFGDDKRVLDGTWRNLFDGDGEGKTESAHAHEEEDVKKKPGPAPFAKKPLAKSEKKVGHKREASQSTLDGMFTRKEQKKEKKDEDVFPNSTHFG
jgi:hypothetical protein